MSPLRTINGGFTESLGDGGILENLLIRANGQTVNITPRGRNWVIRNVGIIGPTGGGPAGVIEPIVEGAGAGRIDNVYVDGAGDNSVFVNARHSGHLKITNSWFGNESEDSVYGSPPGNFPGFAGRKDVGQGGTVHIDNCYSFNSGDYGFRLGSNGSRVTNTTVVNAGVALANLYGNPVLFENCNVAGSETTLRVGDMNSKNASAATQIAKAVVKSCQFNGGESNYDLNRMARGQSVVEGTPGSNPNSDIPAGIPASAEMAANGNSSAKPVGAPSLDKTLKVTGGQGGGSFTITVTQGIEEAARNS